MATSAWQVPMRTDEAGGAGRGGRLGDEPGLADAGVARQQQQPRLARQRVVEDTAHESELVDTADERDVDRERVSGHRSGSVDGGARRSIRRRAVASGGEHGLDVDEEVLGAAGERHGRRRVAERGDGADGVVDVASGPGRWRGRRRLEPRTSRRAAVEVGAVDRARRAAPPRSGPTSSSA